MLKYFCVISVIILYNKEGKMLLEHRTESRKRYPGYWALFGGHIEGDETSEEAVCREAKEELHYDLSRPVFLYTQEVEDGSEKHVFVAAYDEIQPIILDPHESQGYGWFTLEETKMLSKPIPHDVEALEKVFEYIQRQSNV